MGFGAGVRRFYADLAKNNTRTWFEANRGRYEREVLGPAAALVEGMAPRLAKTWPALAWGTQRSGAGSIMRIHRDVRFSADKRPYKENLGILLWIGPGAKMERPAFYLNLDARSAFFYAGFHVLPKPALARYRDAVADVKRGQALERILARLAAGGLEVMEEPAYKRVPAGYPSDHPRATLLRHDGLGVFTDLDAADVADPGLTARLAAVALKAGPLVDWLLQIAG